LTLDDFEHSFAFGCCSKVFITFRCDEKIVLDTDSTHRKVTSKHFLVDVLGMNGRRKVKVIKRIGRKVTGSVNAYSEVVVEILAFQARL
jgi:hypothetical protein